MEPLSEQLKTYEAAFGKVVAAARKKNLFRRGDLKDDPDVASAFGMRALWMDAKQLEGAEEGFREHAEAAARHRGVQTACLEVTTGENPGELQFFLVVPAASRELETRIMTGLQLGLQTIVGSLVIEQEMAKLNVVRMLSLLGKQILAHLKSGDSAKLEGIARVLKERDGDGMAAILSTMALAAGSEVEEVDDSDDHEENR